MGETPKTALAPIKKGGTGIKVPQFIGDLGQYAWVKAKILCQSQFF